MADTGNPKEFFSGALAAVDTLSRDRAQLVSDQLRLKENERALDQLKRKIEKEKSEVIRKRRADIVSDYSSRLSAVESALSRAKEERGKARDTGVKKRISEETQGLAAERQNLKEKLSQEAIFGELPAMCRKVFFYMIFSPRGIPEVLIMLLVLAAAFILLPALLTSFIPMGAVKVVLFILVDIAMLALSLLICSRTIWAKPVETAKCREIATKIRQTGKEITRVTKGILRDKDDSYYHLSEYDAEIAKQTEQKNDLILKRTEALGVFDNETAATLKREIDDRYAEKLTESSEAYEQAASSVKLLSDQVASEEQRITGDYTQYIGKENMSHEKIERMIALIEDGTAAGVQDAVARIKK